MVSFEFFIEPRLPFFLFIELDNLLFVELFLLLEPFEAHIVRFLVQGQCPPLSDGFGISAGEIGGPVGRILAIFVKSVGSGVI